MDRQLEEILKAPKRGWPWNPCPIPQCPPTFTRFFPAPQALLGFLRARTGLTVQRERELALIVLSNSQSHTSCDCSRDTRCLAAVEQKNYHGVRLGPALSSRKFVHLKSRALKSGKLFPALPSVRRKEKQQFLRITCVRHCARSSALDPRTLFCTFQTQSSANRSPTSLQQSL